jgi:hypothetical protein
LGSKDSPPGLRVSGVVEASEVLGVSLRVGRCGASYSPIGWTMRWQPATIAASGQNTTIARSWTTRMARLGRTPQPTVGQAGLARLATCGLCWAVAAALGLTDVGAGLARAQSGDPAAVLAESLTLSSGASCLERDRLIERVVRWREGGTMDRSIRIQVRGDPRDVTRVYFVVARAGLAPTERVLENAPLDCDQLHSAVALSIALAIDALLSAERAARAAETPLPPPPTAAGARRTSGAAAWHMELGLLAGASVSVVPTTAPVLLPRLQLAPLPWAALAIEAAATWSDGIQILGTPGRFNAAVWALGMDACFGGETTERLSFFACTGMRGGAFVTKGFGFNRNRSQSLRWWTAVASGQARAWILPTVAIGISVEALYALAERELSVYYGPNNLVQQRTLSRFGLAIAGGPVFRFF